MGNLQATCAKMHISLQEIFKILKGAQEWMNEHPTTINMFVGSLGVSSVLITELGLPLKVLHSILGSKVSYVF